MSNTADDTQLRARPAWRSRDVAIGIGLLVLLMFVQLLLAWLDALPERPLGLEAEVYRFFPTVLTSYVVLFMAWRRGMSLADLGFNRRRVVWPAFVAWLIAISSGPLFVGIAGLAAVAGYGGSKPITPLLAMLVVGVVVVAPVVEELTFRALLFRAVRQRWHFLPAAFLSSFIFATFHLEAVTLLPLTITGMAFAWAYDRTGSVWASVLPHAGLNALVVIAFVAN